MTCLGGKLADKLPTSNRGRTSHVLEEDSTVGKMKTLHDRGTGRILREYLIYLELFMELLLLKLPRLRDFDHDTRVDLVHERDTSTPDPVDSRILALDIHSGKI